ncbi:MAG: PLP-dependent transferase, partial [Boseongicola sp.]|nr:PLP-dependent transferase [Boseongicola sp.]
FEASIRPETKLILIETVSNPTLRVADVDGIIALAKSRGILVAVDNTFPTPRGCQPLARGADIVIHSVTKLMAGHSDATLGYVAAQDPALAERFLTLAVSMGFTASPFDCWLAERGLYSFDLRYDRCTTTAARLSDALAGMPGVVRVLYPTRSDHPDHNRSISLLGGEGGHMVSFELAGGRAQANAFVRAAEGLNFAPTLGDIATTISHPETSSHRALTPEARSAIGISPGFFRISVGCEAPDALIETLEKAVRAASQV